MLENGKEIALALHLGIKVNEISTSSWEHWGLSSFEANGNEYAIGTDEETTEAANKYILETLWAFSASFIIQNSALPYEAEEMLASFQHDKCEDANDTIKAIISDEDKFCAEAIRWDSRGHFLSGYDGNEEEISFSSKNENFTYYIYRTN